MRKGWIAAGLALGLLLVPTPLVVVRDVGAASTVQDVDNCKYRRITGTPVGVVTGFKLCDRAENISTGTVYKWAGVPGTPDNTSWGIELSGVVTCGDGQVNQPTEQCDAPGGIGAIGSCVDITHCQPDCTCSPPSPCGNGVLDAGEQCDPQDDDHDTCGAGPCNQDCTCPGSCGDGIIDTVRGETCDPGATGGSGTSMGNALNFVLDTARTVPMYVNTGLNTTYAFTTEDFVFEVIFTLADDTLTKYLLWKGGQTNTADGYRILITSDEKLQFDAKSSCGNVRTNCETATNRFTLGETYYVALTRKNIGGVETVRAFKRKILPTLDATMTEMTETCNFNLGCTGLDTPCTDCATSPVDTGTRTGNTWAAVNNVLHLGGRNTTPTSDFPWSGAYEEARVRSGASGSGVVDDFIANRMLSESVQTLNCSTTPNMTGCWHFDETGVTALDNEKSTTNAVGNGGVTTITSPVPNVVGGTACPAGTTCQGPACTCQTTGTNPTTKYANRTGTLADTAGDGSTGNPWSVVWALSPNNPNGIKPGSTLKLKPGVYSAFDVKCGSFNTDTTITDPPTTCDGAGATALCGTQAAPITIEGEEWCNVTGSGSCLSPGTPGVHHVRIETNGLDSAVYVGGCEWITLRRMLGVGADNINASGLGDSNWKVEGSSHVTLEQIIGHTTNRYRNGEIFMVLDSTDTTLREVYAKNYHRHGTQNSGSKRSVFDRVYTNTGNRPFVACPCNASFPCGPNNLCGTDANGVRTAEDFAIYPARDCTVINSVAEGGGMGLRHNGGKSYDGQNSQNNHFFNTISLNARQGGAFQTRSAGPDGSRNDILQDVLVWRGAGQPAQAGRQESNGFFGRTITNATFRHVTVGKTGGGLNGLVLNETSGWTCAQVTGGGACAGNVLDGIFAYQNDGIGIQTSSPISCSTVSRLSAFGNGTNSSLTGACTGTVTTTDPGVAFGDTGTGCISHCRDATTDGACRNGSTATWANSRAADLRCMYNSSGTRLTGSSNSTFITATGDTTCDGPEDHPCKGAHVALINIPVIKDINDGTTLTGIGAGVDGWSLPKRLNIKSDNSACPLTELPCP